MMILFYKVELRDSRGRFAPLSRAKTFKVYGKRGGVFIPRTQFPPEVKRAFDRETYVDEAIQIVERRRERAAQKARERRALRRRGELIKRVPKTRSLSEKAKLVREIFQLGGSIEEAQKLIMLTLEPTDRERKVIASPTMRRALDIVKYGYEPPQVLMTNDSYGKMMKDLFDPYLKRSLKKTMAKTKTDQMYFKLRFRDADDPKTEVWVSAPRKLLGSSASADRYVNKLQRKLFDSFVNQEKYFSSEDRYFIDKVEVEGTKGSSRLLTDTELRKVSRNAQKTAIDLSTPARRRRKVSKKKASKKKASKKKASKKKASKKKVFKKKASKKKTKKKTVRKKKKQTKRR